MWDVAAVFNHWMDGMVGSMFFSLTFSLDGFLVLVRVVAACLRF
jgi:hypothetical protein